MVMLHRQTFLFCLSLPLLHAITEIIVRIHVYLGVKFKVGMDNSCQGAGENCPHECGVEFRVSFALTSTLISMQVRALISLFISAKG